MLCLTTIREARETSYVCDLRGRVALPEFFSQRAGRTSQVILQGSQSMRVEKKLHQGVLHLQAVERRHLENFKRFSCA